MTDLDEKAAVEAVRNFLKEAGSEAEVIFTDETIFTVSDAAKAVDAPESEILKSILLKVNRGEYYALALMSGVNRVDTKKIKKLLGASRITFANADECFDFSGFRPGGVSPVGYDVQPKTFLDDDLFLHGRVWSAAGTDRAVFPVSPEELLKLTGGERADIKKV